MSLTVLSNSATVRAIVRETACGSAARFEEFVGGQWRRIALTAMPYPFHTACDIACGIVDRIEAGEISKNRGCWPETFASYYRESKLAS